MGLNLKNPEAHQLAQDLAALTGESMTAAVTTALRERLERIRRERSKEQFMVEIDQIVMGFQRALGKSRQVPDHGSMLYDENGLPK
jgi:antitoxin VapB